MYTRRCSRCVAELSLPPAIQDGLQDTALLAAELGPEVTAAAAAAEQAVAAAGGGAAAAAAKQAAATGGQSGAGKAAATAAATGGSGVDLEAICSELARRMAALEDNCERMGVPLFQVSRLLWRLTLTQLRAALSLAVLLPALAWQLEPCCYIL